jgi:hypothetical protein
VVLSRLNKQHDDVQTLRRQAGRLLRRRSKEGAQDSAAMVQKLADLPPYQRVWFAQLILGAALLACSSPVEIAVLVLRVLLRQRGVQTGAAAGTLLTFLASHAYTTAIRRQLTTEASADGEDQNNPWFDRWVTRAIFCGALVLPAVGGVLPGAVVLRRRSPLWGLALWAFVRLVAVMVLAVDASRLSKRRKTEEAASASAASVDEL